MAPCLFAIYFNLIDGSNLYFAIYSVFLNLNTCKICKIVFYVT